MLAMCDLNMLKFLPWKKSKFYIISEGYPSFPLMMFCLIWKVLDGVNTVTCELIYLTGSGSRQTRTLFIINVVFSSALLAEILIVALRSSTLVAILKSKMSSQKGKTVSPEINEEETAPKMMQSLKTLQTVRPFVRAWCQPNIHFCKRGSADGPNVINPFSQELV